MHSTRQTRSRTRSLGPAAAPGIAPAAPAPLQRRRSQGIIRPQQVDVSPAPAAAVPPPPLHANTSPVMLWFQTTLAWILAAFWTFVKGTEREDIATGELFVDERPVDQRAFQQATRFDNGDIDFLELPRAPVAQQPEAAPSRPKPHQSRGRRLDFTRFTSATMRGIPTIGETSGDDGFSSDSSQDASGLPARRPRRSSSRSAGEKRANCPSCGVVVSTSSSALLSHLAECGGRSSGRLDAATDQEGKADTASIHSLPTTADDDAMLVQAAQRIVAHRHEANEVTGSLHAWRAFCVFTRAFWTSGSVPNTDVQNPACLGPEPLAVPPPADWGVIVAVANAIVRSAPVTEPPSASVPAAASEVPRPTLFSPQPDHRQREEDKYEGLAAADGGVYIERKAKYDRAVVFGPMLVDNEVTFSLKSRCPLSRQLAAIHAMCQDNRVLGDDKACDMILSRFDWTTLSKPAEAKDAMLTGFLNDITHFMPVSANPSMPTRYDYSAAISNYVRCASTIHGDSNLLVGALRSIGSAASIELECLTIQELAGAARGGGSAAALSESPLARQLISRLNRALRQWNQSVKVLITAYLSQPERGEAVRYHYLACYRDFPDFAALYSMTPHVIPTAAPAQVTAVERMRDFAGAGGHRVNNSNNNSAGGKPIALTEGEAAPAWLSKLVTGVTPGASLESLRQGNPDVGRLVVKGVPVCLRWLFFQRCPGCSRCHYSVDGKVTPQKP